MAATTTPDKRTQPKEDLARINSHLPKHGSKTSLPPELSSSCSVPLSLPSPTEDAGAAISSSAISSACWCLSSDLTCLGSIENRCRGTPL
eukprot:CAMPEP_0204200976 /NCGR_PEP_ID=MMETSP0361-20130328/67127_1 /ASSEMBLY_ACC=CAM_ASM_000343 /TAXON_ID=268821 /ORGANISM="Scrippsiella Hangoei, Strain SHTV-5" /LENGTH=89 /DNA_ID=CAMNT_0051163519 /DNA_START=232 /DNA_END=498 /DNA_ORIENTATION=+